jgi:hypothetical protein
VLILKLVEPGPFVVKHKKGKPLRSAEKRCVLNVFTEVREDNHITLDEMISLVAYETGISKASVCLARKEVKNNGKLVNPKETQKLKQVKTQQFYEIHCS